MQERTETSGFRKTDLSVLVVEDDAGDAELLRRLLERLPRYSIRMTHVTGVAAAREALASGGIEVVFLDYQLGAETGLDLLRELRAAGEIRPVIMLTGCGDESVAVAVMQAGADDYVSKGTVQPALLGRAIDNGRAHHVGRQLEARNRQLLEDLQLAKAMLELKNRRLAELYQTAHEFVDHVSHEFRTPLTVIREFASIIRDGLAGEANDEQRKYLGIVIHRVDDLSVLVEDMLDISKLEAGMLGINRSDCSVADIIEQARPVLERRASMAGAGLSIAISPDLPAVYCDAEKVERILINLVINALKFCGEGGAVDLRVTSVPADSVVLFSISDNGCGIAPEMLQSLFQRFRQVHGQPRQGIKGFGLGLSIAKELVTLNLGEITVESKVGAGTTFSFSVPFADRATLLPRYLSRVEELRSGSTTVGLVRVCVAQSLTSTQDEEIDHLLRHIVRRTDLLFRTVRGSWLLVVPMNQKSLAPITDRIEKTYLEMNRNRLHGNLPSPGIEQIGTWDIHDEAPAFIEAFQAHQGPVEASVHA